jgi:hypothetical protein
MHLSPAAIESAIRTLESRTGLGDGDLLETPSVEPEKQAI